MEKTDFIQAGFSPVLGDPFVKYECLLSDPESEDRMAIGFINGVTGQSFAIITPSGDFIYFNANNPLDAISWAKSITGCEPNY